MFTVFLTSSEDKDIVAAQQAILAQSAALEEAHGFSPGKQFALNFS